MTGILRTNKDSDEQDDGNVECKNMIVSSVKPAESAVDSSPPPPPPRPPSPVQRLRRSLEELEASLGASRADEALLLRSHARLSRHAHALSAALQQATHCNRLLVNTLWRHSACRSSGMDSRSDGEASDKFRRSVSREQIELEQLKYVEQLHRELDVLQDSMRSRERAVLNVCVKYLQMKRRRDLQAAREAKLLRTVRGLQAVLVCTANMLRRVTQLLRHERGQCDADCAVRRAPPLPRRVHTATQTILSELACRSHGKRLSVSSSSSSSPSPSVLTNVEYYRTPTIEMGNLPDVITLQRGTQRQFINDFGGTEDSDEQRVMQYANQTESTEDEIEKIGEE